MLTILLLTLLLQTGGRTVTIAPTTTSSPDPAAIPAADPEPDAITRGQSTVVVVRGSSLDALKTLTIEPADGIRLGPIEPLPPRPDGSQAVRVTITVENGVAPGDRDLMLTVAPTMSIAPRAGTSNDETSRKIDEALRAILARETRPMPVGTLHINSHDVKVTRASFVRSGSSFKGTVVIDDARGDIGERARPPLTVSGGSGITLVPVSDPLTIQARCGGEVIDLFGDDVKVGSRQGSSTTVTTTIEADQLRNPSSCEVRVRAEDAEGNLSPWVTAQFSGR